MKMLLPCTISSRFSCSYPAARLRHAVFVAMAFACFSLSVLGPVAHALQLQARPSRDGQEPFLQVHAAPSGAPGGGEDGGRGVSGPSTDGIPPAVAAVRASEEALQGGERCLICFDDGIPAHRMKQMCRAVTSAGDPKPHFVCVDCAQQWVRQ
ncbi:unnamed protein product [Amoebophrya sp. A120]|nr:unnamed protein product [Amoebophrya sp. A120]|eukprot:GSA120T00023133001.1